VEGTEEAAEAANGKVGNEEIKKSKVMESK